MFDLYTYTYKLMKVLAKCIRNKIKYDLKKLNAFICKQVIQYATPLPKQT